MGEKEKQIQAGEKICISSDESGHKNVGGIKTDEPVKWAICGLGKISKRFLKVLRSVPDTEVVACVSSSKERALAYGKKYGIKHALTYDELAANPNIADAVYISTHMNAHAKPTMLYLNAKIPVLCEKSFAVSEAEALQMIQCAKDNDTLLMEAMWTRFLPATLYVQELLKSGKLGAIKSARARFEVGIGHGLGSRVFKKEVGGGSILDVGVYPTTYTHMLLGMPQSICANGRIKNGVEVNCNTEFIYPNGVKAKFRVSVEFMTLKEHYIIECENGTITVPSFYGATKVKVKYNNGRKEVKKFEKIDGFTYEVRHFNQLIRENAKESPVMTHQITLEVVRLLEAQLKAVGIKF